jgi:hypothetical protein
VRLCHGGCGAVIPTSRKSAACTDCRRRWSANWLRNTAERLGKRLGGVRVDETGEFSIPARLLKTDSKEYDYRLRVHTPVAARVEKVGWSRSRDVDLYSWTRTRWELP